MQPHTTNPDARQSRFPGRHSFFDRHFRALAGLLLLPMASIQFAVMIGDSQANDDVPVTLCFLAAVLGWNAFLASGRMSRAAACGILSGAAMCTKYSSLLLFPIYILLYALSWWRLPGNFRHSLGHLTKSMLVLLATGFLAVFVIFRFEWMRDLIPADFVGSSFRVYRIPGAAPSMQRVLLTHNTVLPADRGCGEHQGNHGASVPAVRSNTWARGGRFRSPVRRPATGAGLLHGERAAACGRKVR